MPNSVRIPSASTDVCSYMAFYSLGESLTPAPTPPLLSLLPPEAAPFVNGSSGVTSSTSNGVIPSSTASSSSSTSGVGGGVASLSASRLLAADVDPLSVSRFQTPDAAEAPLEQVC